jgi:hypothetical protein
MACCRGHKLVVVSRNKFGLFETGSQPLRIRESPDDPFGDPIKGTRQDAIGHRRISTSPFCACIAPGPISPIDPDFGQRSADRRSRQGPRIVRGECCRFVALY